MAIEKDCGGERKGFDGIIRGGFVGIKFIER